jgi:hypothetical protein
MNDSSLTQKALVRSPRKTIAAQIFCPPCCLPAGRKSAHLWICFCSQTHFNEILLKIRSTSDVK